MVGGVGGDEESGNVSGNDAVQVGIDWRREIAYREPRELYDAARFFTLDDMLACVRAHGARDAINLVVLALLAQADGA